MSNFAMKRFEAYQALTGKVKGSNMVEAAKAFASSAINIYDELDVPGSSLRLIETHRIIGRETVEILQKTGRDPVVVDAFENLLPVVERYDREFSFCR